MAISDWGKRGVLVLKLAFSFGILKLASGPKKKATLPDGSKLPLTKAEASFSTPEQSQPWQSFQP